MQNFKKYIVPFVDNDSMGCGFFIRNYFVTAAHLFDEYETHTIFFNGLYHNFNKSDAVYFKSFEANEPDDVQQDIAIFPFNDINSPLKLSPVRPNLNSHLYSYSYTQSRGTLDPFTMIKSECIVKRDLFNFFECKTDKILKSGSSGSPLMIENIVYGILSGCLDVSNQPDFILFCSTTNLPTLCQFNY